MKQMHPEPEVCSMKVLLKQVYGIHTSKIKCLEDEIEELKRNLQEATTKLKNYESECKRCIELEEAFSSCKAALFEQSKMFENLGQKLSNFNTTENKTSEEKKLTILQEIVDGPTVDPSINVAPVKKIDLSTNSKIHFLKNLMTMNADENQDSLEFTEPLQKNVYQEYSTLNPDSLILVPNTMDFGCEDKESQKKLGDKTHECISTGKKELLETNMPDTDKNSENKERRKRLSEDDSDLNNDKSNKENDVKSSFGNKKLKSSRNDDCTPVMKLANVTTSPKQKNLKNGADIFNNSKKINTPVLDIKICKVVEDDFVDEPKNATDGNCSSVSDNTKDDSFKVTVSPSLLPLKEKINAKIIHYNPKMNKNSSSISAIPKEDSFQATVASSLQPIKEKTNSKIINNHPTMAEDINDFQILSSNRKANSEGGTWTSCDKKKLARKSSYPRPIKSTSRFKMQLDTLPPNFKKPTYRQTKLSRSIFQPKSTTGENQESDIVCVEVDEKVKDFAKDSLTVSRGVPAPSSSSKTVDFDATCIPDNYEYEIISSNSISSTKPKGGKAFPNSIMIVKDDSDSFDSDSSSEMIIEQKSSTSKHGKGKDDLNSKHIEVGPLGNSFDRLPKKPEPDYKYKEETVRKKSERKQLLGFDCKECENYYTDLGLSDEEKKQRMQKCSRHRGKFVPPSTPEHFWELEFPDTQECKARGYLNTTQKVTLKTHRRRPL
nr:DNA endonuclease RBBP8 isoform X1 [Parasteatoda tepidariorum]